MSRWNRKKKKWLLARAIRLGKKKKLRRRSRSFNAPVGKNQSKLENRKKLIEAPVVQKVVPSVFSLTLNTEGTIGFISDLMDEIRHRQFKKTIVIDSSNVEKVTVDALIYLIAIMQNNTINKEMLYTFQGNFPNNEEANRVYQESGFTDYVNSTTRKFPENTDKKRICFGKLNDSEKAAQFCKFVMNKFNRDRVYTIPLQKVLLELLSNVAHHAYEKSDPAIAHNWYMYAEYIENRIRFVFVDTGLGIINTVRKKISEQLFIFFNPQAVEGDILKSVFLGDFLRTETRQSYRGNGLKTVYEDVLNGPFENFNVITGKGLCSINTLEKNISCRTFSKSLHGTLFTFEYILN